VQNRTGRGAQRVHDVTAKGTTVHDPLCTSHGARHHGARSASTAFPGTLFTMTGDRRPLRTTPWVWSVPALAALTLFGVVPLAAVVRYAGWEWSGTSTPTPIGFGNVARLLRDDTLWASLVTTGTFLAFVLPAFLGLSLAVAWAIEGTRFERLVKAIAFAPGIVTASGAAIAWFLLYHPDFGWLYETTGVALPWTWEPWAATAYVIAFTLWQQTGFGIVIVSAALRGIPRDVKEAARLDGANETTVRFRIVFPMLAPTLGFLSILGTLFVIQSYSAVFLLTRGGPFGSTRVLGYYLFETAFERFDLGYGAALTLFVLVFALSVAALQAAVLARRRTPRRGA
jgi:multiple sugar transport system permease protein